VEWRDNYFLFDAPDEDFAGGHSNGEPDYPDLMAQIGDIRPRAQLVPPGQHPFAVAQVRRNSQMVFNLPSYQQMLLDDFMRDGGSIEQREFTHPRQFAALPERTLVNATGYGARALLGDDSITPVRGQTARLIPQPEVRYGLNWSGHNVSAVSRRDGILVQAQADGDFNNPDTTPDRAATLAAVQRLASLFPAASHPAVQK
jgi:hypothetical protein